MLNLTVNQCLVIMAFLVPLVIWLASRPINDYICLSDDSDHEELKENPSNHVNERYGAYIQAQGRYYN